MTAWVKKYEKTCEWCGDEFKAARTIARYCSDNCRKRAGDDRSRGTCIDCGGLMAARTGWTDVSYPRRLRCAECERNRQAVQKDALAARYEALWADGLTLQQIADEMGLAHKFAAGAIVSMYRGQGRNFPYRRSAQAVKNIREGQDRARAAA